MNRTKSSDIDEKILEKIISAAYGDAGFFDRLAVKKLAEKNPAVKKLLREYSDTAAAVRNIEPEECPPSVLHYAEVLTGQKTESRKGFLSDLYTFAFAKPVLTLAVSVIIIAGVFSTIFIDRSSVRLNYTAEEIRAADLQTREALAIVGKIFESTNETLKNEILKNKVSPPVSRGMKVVNQLLDKENRNEIN